MNKYLIILAGSPRGGEKTYSSLYKYVKNHLNADLALCTTEDMYDESISLFQNLNCLYIVYKERKRKKGYTKKIKIKRFNKTKKLI